MLRGVLASAAARRGAPGRGCVLTGQGVEVVGLLRALDELSDEVRVRDEPGRVARLQEEAARPRRPLRGHAAHRDAPRLGVADSADVTVMAPALRDLVLKEALDPTMSL